MDIVGPESKRPRLTGPAPSQWQNSTETSRQLPPPAATSYHNSPFARPPPEPQHHLDRRPPGHTEHQQYEHQDPRRPSSGPSHGYHHPPGPPSFATQREPPKIKRDPSDEPPSQHYRPSSTPTDVIPPPVLHDPSRSYHPPYDPHHQGPPPYRSGPASYPPPQSPITITDPYHQQSHFGSQPQTPRDFSSVSYPPTNHQNPKRPKAQRAAQACDSCRTLKGKCDEGRPSCASCREKGIECKYRDPPPKQHDKATGEIMDSISALQSMVVGMRNDFRSLEKRTDELYARLSHLPMEPQHLSVGPTMKQELRESIAPSVETPYTRPAPEAQPQPHPQLQPQLSSSSANNSPYTSTPSMLQPLEKTDKPAVEGYEGESEEETSGNAAPLKAPSIPINHTTGAARLLLVPAISEMCRDIMKHHKIKNEKYPIIQEEKRGLLRIYGRGEGIDVPPGYERDPLIDHGSESVSGDTNSDVSSPAGEEWGQVGRLTASGNPPDFPRPGAINAEGLPDFSRDTVESLVQAYKDNINNMHPILVPSRLDVLIETFLKSTPESQARSKQVAILAGHRAPGVGFIGGAGGHPESPGNKRKWSPALHDLPEPQGYYDVKPGHPYRSISSCLVLMVLALGSVVRYKGKIPDCLPEREREFEASWAPSPTIRNGHPQSPMQSSPALSTPLGPPSPQDNDRTQSRSRRTSIEGAYTSKVPPGATPKAKNLDTIPGLAYFALATDIIGNQLAGNSLQHVHCNILAGLYHAQLGRVMESHGYIYTACRALQVILRPKLDRFRSMKGRGEVVPAKDNPLVITFWTCLQLESDIVAELPCPHSGILTYEDDMPGPNFTAGATHDGFDPIVMESYGGQLFLRKHLNMLHNMFYKPENDSQFPSVYAGQQPKHFPTIEACQDSLNNIPVFAPNMTWNDNDPLARDILGARLRAKYYGAQVITYRHFVLKILDSHHKKEMPNDTINSEFKNGIIVPDVTKVGIDAKALEYAECGIKALIRSTSAFHGLGDPGLVRLTVTNIWGTAHAQWGNVLVLQAAYKDPILKRFIDESTLRGLLVKTVAFLKLVANSSSALNIDLKILQHTGRLLKLLPGDVQNTSSSFSSSATGETPISGY